MTQPSARPRERSRARRCCRRRRPARCRRRAAPARCRPRARCGSGRPRCRRGREHREQPGGAALDQLLVDHGGLPSPRWYGRASSPLSILTATTVPVGTVVLPVSGSVGAGVGARRRSTRRRRWRRRSAGLRRRARPPRGFARRGDQGQQAPRRATRAGTGRLEHSRPRRYVPGRPPGLSSRTPCRRCRSTPAARGGRPGAAPAAAGAAHGAGVADRAVVERAGQAHPGRGGRRARRGSASGGQQRQGVAQRPRQVVLDAPRGPAGPPSRLRRGGLAARRPPGRAAGAAATARAAAARRTSCGVEGRPGGVDAGVQPVQPPGGPGDVEQQQHDGDGRDDGGRHGGRAPLGAARAPAGRAGADRRASGAAS